MAESSGSNWALKVYNPWPGVMPEAPASHDYQGGFGVTLMNKDLRLAQEAALKSHSTTRWAHWPRVSTASMPPLVAKATTSPAFSASMRAGMSDRPRRESAMGDDAQTPRRVAGASGLPVLGGCSAGVRAQSDARIERRGDLTRRSGCQDFAWIACSRALRACSSA